MLRRSALRSSGLFCKTNCIPEKMDIISRILHEVVKSDYSNVNLKALLEKYASELSSEDIFSMHNQLHRWGGGIEGQNIAYRMELVQHAVENMRNLNQHEPRR